VVCNKHVYDLHAYAFRVAKEKQHGVAAKVEVMSESAVSLSGFALYILATFNKQGETRNDT